jgi:prophage DNA circulation protein
MSGTSWDWNFPTFIPGLGLLDATGWFRGCPFRLETYSTEFGRRVDLHEYPLRNLPNAEDLGRKARKFQFQCYVLGPAWELQRDALINACEADGPGLLVHPFHGEHTVMCDAGKVSEGKAGGERYAAFELTFVEYGSFDSPDYTADPGSSLLSLAASGYALVSSAFSSSWDVSGTPNFVADDSVECSEQLLAFEGTAMQRSATNIEAYNDAYAAVFGGHDLEAFILQPPDTVAEGIVTVVRTVGVFAIKDDGAAQETLLEQSSWSPDLSPVRSYAKTNGGVALYTPTRERQLTNRTAFTLLTNRAAALAYAERLPGTPIQGARQALKLRNDIASMFDGIINDASVANDGTATALSRIKSTSLALIAARAGPIEDDGVMVTTTSLPSLVCAHYAYREARQAPRMRQANPAAHSNFMAKNLIVVPWP